MEVKALKFIKENLHRILRVFVMQIGVAIFALIVTLTTSAVAGDQRGAMALVASIFSIGFYLFLVFYCMREEGSRDSARIEAGRLKYDGFYGAKVGAVAVLPNYVLILFMVIGMLIGLESGGVGIWAAGYYITTMLQSMYGTVLRSILTAMSLSTSVTAAAVAYAVTPVFSVIAAWYGYVFGVQHPTVDRKPL